MGLVRGNPLMLVTLFFGAAVLLMGTLYAVVPMVLRDATPVAIAAMLALGASLTFCLLIVGRVFWVMARGTHRGKAVDRK